MLLCCRFKVVVDKLLAVLIYPCRQLISCANKGLFSGLNQIAETEKINFGSRFDATTLGPLVASFAAMEAAHIFVAVHDALCTAHWPCCAYGICCPPSCGKLAGDALVMWWCRLKMSISSLA